jgi:signal transduction histidine kinase
VEEEDFASMTSHAFRALLAVVDGNAQRLMAQADQLTAHELRDRAQRIRGAVRGMLQLIDEWVGDSRSGMQTRRFRYHPGTVDLVAILREVCELQRELVPEAQIHLRLGTEPVGIWGDATLLRQVFGNIVANAVRYSVGAAEVMVSLDRVEETEVTVLIEDSGIGIPPQERGNVFDPYYRCSNAGGVVGQGLGLYVVKKLLDLHRGAVTLGDRSDASGTAFAVRLPRSAPIS